MAKPGAVRQGVWAVKEGGREGGILSKTTWSKKKTKNYSKLTERNMKLRSLKTEWEKKAVTEATSLTPVTSTSSSESSYSSRQSLGKAVARTVRMLCKTPGKKKQVLSKIVSTLSPCSKTTVYTSAWRKLDHNSILGRAKISSGLRQTVISFLEKPDISYCKPGRKDMVYIGKDENGES